MAFFARAISLTQHLSAATPKSSSSVSPAKTLKIFYNNIATASSNNSSFAPHNLHLVWLIVNSTSSTSVNRPLHIKTRQFHSAPAKMVQQISAREQYENALKKSDDKLVVIDFFATWCGPCKIIAPQVEKMSKEFEHDVEFYKVDVDDNQQIAGELAVRAMPTFLFFKKGKKLDDEVVGANVKALRAAIEKNCKKE